jgi:DHA1 family bicyclomycin/chloramphenicol resistance-like MFS transporter
MGYASDELVLKRSSHVINLKKVRLIAFVSLLSAFPPLTTDMYLPALPTMANDFAVPLGIINLTLMVFFIFFSVSILLWGPLSDKYGRKPILIWGTGLFCVATVGCIFSTHVYLLIFFRGLEAAGGGSAMAMSMAILKDLYGPQERDKAIAAVGTIMAVAPIIAPIFGAALLAVTSWRGIFAGLLVLGLIAFISCLMMNETLLEPSDRSILQSFERLTMVYTNRSFASMLFLFSFPMLAGMGFIGTSSMIFINGFGVSEQAYSYYFALNALFFPIGPLLYIFLTRFYSPRMIIHGSNLVMIFAGLGTILFGSIGPLIFILTVIPFFLASTTVKSPGMNLIMETAGKDAGTASALMGCTFSILSSIGVMIASFDWSNRIVTLGVMITVTGLVSFLMWMKLQVIYQKISPTQAVKEKY